MKGKEVRKELTNIFEIALHQEFRKLQLGEPDKKVRKAIDKAAKKVTEEVKRLMKEQQKQEAKRRKEELKKLRATKPKKTAKKTAGKRGTGLGKNDIVDNIVA